MNTHLNSLCAEYLRNAANGNYTVCDSIRNTMHQLLCEGNKLELAKAVIKLNSICMAMNQVDASERDIVVRVQDLVEKVKAIRGLI